MATLKADKVDWWAAIWRIPEYGQIGVCEE